MNKPRNESWNLLCEYTKSDSLRRHALAVEAAMRAAADVYGDDGADKDEWGLTGLLHDFDYEQFPTPDLHPYTGVRMLREQGYPETMLEAIMGHAPYTGVARRTRMAQALFAVDELSGFVVACALVRPGRTLEGLEASSVKKKLKDKAFARTVSREDVYLGIEELGVDASEHIRFVINTLREVESEIGLGA